MSNSLQDAMAEVILRAIIRFPDRCPPELREKARVHQDIWRRVWNEDVRLQSGTWLAFKKALETHADALPAILEGFEP